MPGPGRPTPAPSPRSTLNCPLPILQTPSLSTSGRPHSRVGSFIIVIINILFATFKDVEQRTKSYVLALVPGAGRRGRHGRGAARPRRPEPYQSKNWKVRKWRVDDERRTPISTFP